MPIQRKHALLRINQLVPRILEHLEKMRSEPFALEYNHWRIEVRAWVKKVETLARQTGRQTQAEVMQNVTQWKEAAALRDE